MSMGVVVRQEEEEEEKEEEREEVKGESVSMRLVRRQHISYKSYNRREMWGWW